jgi:hypothetical protein
MKEHSFKVEVVQVQNNLAVEMPVMVAESVQRALN